MSNKTRHLVPSLCLLALAIPAGAGPVSLGSFGNSEGKAATLSLSGPIKRSQPFFQDLGSNGRRCVSCHDKRQGWSITPAAVQKRFRNSAGADPIFRSNDGSNSPGAPVADLASRTRAYGMLLNKAVFRIGLHIPANAEFQLAAVQDPYGFVSAAASDPELSLFRRPMPATNLKFMAAVMWDGRESDGTRTIAEDLARQANTATTGHAQGSDLSEAQRQSIVAFETGLFSAQTSSRDAGSLVTRRIPGGARNLAKTSFEAGMNAPYRDGAANPAFDRRVFKLFDAWRALRDPAGDDPRAAIARGQEIFNSRPFVIRNLPGINDEAVFGQPVELTATCSTCHQVPGVGSSSLPLFFNTGVSDEGRRTSDLPLYTLRHKITGETITTTDPGRALITGLWKDVGRFKVPTLRVLAARPPYFHNGSAATLGDVVAFYNSRFGLDLDNREWRDLVSFLSAL